MKLKEIDVAKCQEIREEVARLIEIVKQGNYPNAKAAIGLLHVRYLVGKTFTEDYVRRLAQASYTPNTWEAFAAVRRLFLHNNITVMYPPNRWRYPHPLTHFPWSLDLEITPEQKTYLVKWAWTMEQKRSKKETV
jgi:hypothetical protein